jgi:hypothetical protein
MLNEFCTILLLAPRNKKIEEDHFLLSSLKLAPFPHYVYLPFHSLYFSSRCVAGKDTFISFSIQCH